MRKLSIILLFIVIFAACDHVNHHDFYIQNNCEESIEVTLNYSGSYNVPASGRPLMSNCLIEPNTCKLVGAEGAISVCDDIRWYFTSIVIKKNGVISNGDNLDYSRWSSSKKSKYHTESYLTINPEDFE